MTTVQGPDGLTSFDAAPDASSDAHPDRAPISLTQQSSLLMAPHNPSKEFMSWVYQLNGRLNVEALLQAVDDVVAAHEILRVRFLRGPDGPYQQVTPYRPGVVKVVNLEDRPKMLGLATAVRAVEADYRDLDPWDESRLTATLYRIDPKTHVLALFVAEALVDGESGTLVASELSRAYATHAGKEPPDLPMPSDGSYLRYVLDNPVSEAAQERAVAHWAALRQEPMQAGSWPTALSGPARVRFFNVPADHWTDLVSSTPGMSTVPFVVGLSWLELALNEVVGAERFVVTSAVSNRSRPGAKDIIGNFVGPVRLLAEVAQGEQLDDVSPRVVVALRKALAASVVPVPLAEARITAPAPYLPPEPTVSFFMFGEREGPDLAGVRQRRFRVHSGRDMLRVNITPDDVGGRNVFLLTQSAPPELLDQLVGAFRRRLGL